MTIFFANDSFFLPIHLKVKKLFRNVTFDQGRSENNTVKFFSKNVNISSQFRFKRTL